MHTQLSAVQFHLITTTILLLSREGLRRGCLRFRPDSDKKAGVACICPRPDRNPLVFTQCRQPRMIGQKGFHLTICILSAHSLSIAPAELKDVSVDAKSVLSVAWLALPMGLLVATAIVLGVLKMSDSPSNSPYRIAVVLHGRLRRYLCGFIYATEINTL